MTKLSVNINKIATLRNARGHNNPNLVQVAIDCQKYGAQGITIHPRPDERHITTQDVYDLRGIILTEYNIEGYPDERYLRLIKDVKPHQATLVPDPPGAITSSFGWDTVKHQSFLKEMVSEIKSYGVRVSIFLDPNPHLVASARSTGTDRIELYTEPYASLYPQDANMAIEKYKATAREAVAAGLELNAGHDLNLHNLGYFLSQLPEIKEVSIGHALICDALYFGLENTIQMYLQRCEKAV